MYANLRKIVVRVPVFESESESVSVSVSVLVLVLVWLLLWVHTGARHQSRRRSRLVKNAARLFS